VAAAAKEVAARSSHDREARAERRAAGGKAKAGAARADEEQGVPAPPAKRARAAAKPRAARAADTSAEELSEYERERDEQKARNQLKLEELGLA